MQLIQKPGGQKILLDGAHNVAGAKVLCQALEKYFVGTRRILVLGVLQDKDWRQICETLAPLAARIYTVPVSSERTADARKLAAACRAANSTAEIVACGSLREALEKNSSGDFVIVTGSLYLVGEALESFGLSPATSDERALNEWSTCPQPLPASG
jgi:dihydrofolate synthase/folylpolyglutamate synthase